MAVEQLDRIEQKLNKIIRFFNIDQEPRRSNQELDRLADEGIQEMMRRRNLKVINDN